MKFSRLLRAIRTDPDARQHPEIKAMLRGFQKINAVLTKGTGAGKFTLAQLAQIGRGFDSIGAAYATRYSRTRRTRVR